MSFFVKEDVNNSVLNQFNREYNFQKEFGQFFLKSQIISHKKDFYYINIKDVKDL